MKKTNAIVRLYVDGKLVDERITRLVCKDVETWRKRVENDYRRGYHREGTGTIIKLELEEV